ncbi:Acetyltransferase domain-containing protein [Desulfonema limicola]|uniref:Acetyltransferase domain-containing protein n=1 Tax=Desulfonema limicola TaxID=45656 RepID=A0A975BAU3_9BACT|nr:hypothetical protein [Desulfonema limicola]QTA81895.1 Acetyltransferase domain-containing protein [Desulfonema limicola]
MKYNNKIFIVFFAGILIIIPLVNWIGSIVLDESFFAFRAWEVMTNTSSENVPFKPNAEFEKIIYGDLANMLKVKKFRKYRYQKFTTDPYGFRNPAYKENTYYPVVATGDSDMAGSSLSDERIFSICLENKLGVPVYNYAPSTPIDVLINKRFINHPPKFIIWEEVERFILSYGYNKYLTLSPNSIIVLRQSGKAVNQEKDLPRFTDYFAAQIFYETRWRLFEILPPSIGYIDENTGMLCYSEGLNMLKTSPRQRGIDVVLNGIERVHKYCMKRGIKLIYIPLPDKENIYQDLLPENLKQGYPGKDFLELLHEGLDARNILNVKLIHEFRKQAEKGELVYFQDDTHWNEKGVSIAAEMTAELIKLNLNK